MVVAAVRHSTVAGPLRLVAAVGNISVTCPLRSRPSAAIGHNAVAGPLRSRSASAAVTADDSAADAHSRAVNALAQGPKTTDGDTATDAYSWALHALTQGPGATASDSAAVQTELHHSLRPGSRSRPRSRSRSRSGSRSLATGAAALLMPFHPQHPCGRPPDAHRAAVQLLLRYRSGSRSRSKDG